MTILLADITFFVNSTDATADLLWTWALTSIIAHSLAVVGTVVVTGFVKDVFTTPLMNTLLMGLFLGGILATAKISYTHGLAQEATSTENVHTDAIAATVPMLPIRSCDLTNLAFAFDLRRSRTICPLPSRRLRSAPSCPTRLLPRRPRAASR